MQSGCWCLGGKLAAHVANTLAIICMQDKTVEIK